MKKTILIAALVAASIMGCKKHCFTCTDLNGQEIREKCFNTENEKFEYLAGQVGLANSDRCK